MRAAAQRAVAPRRLASPRAGGLTDVVGDLRALLAFAAPYRPALVFGVVLMLLESAAALAVPWLGGKLAGAFLRGHDPPAADRPRRARRDAGPVRRAGAAQVRQRVSSSATSARRSSPISRFASTTICRRCRCRSFTQRRQGDTLALLTRDVYVVSGYVSGTALAIVPLLFTVAGAVFFMFRLEPIARAARGVRSSRCSSCCSRSSAAASGRSRRS